MFEIYGFCINKANSNVIQIDENTAEIYLEVENTGESTVILEEFYIDNDTNLMNYTSYLSGSPILEPGQTAYIKFDTFADSFHPIRTSHKIGVKTPNNIIDEILITSNEDGYEISIMEDERIASSETEALYNDYFRDKIPETYPVR